MGAASSKQSALHSGEVLDPEMLQPRIAPKPGVVNMKKVEALIRKQKLAPF